MFAFWFLTLVLLEMSYTYNLLFIHIKRLKEIIVFKRLEIYFGTILLNTKNPLLLSGLT